MVRNSFPCDYVDRGKCLEMRLFSLVDTSENEPPDITENDAAISIQISEMRNRNSHAQLRLP